MEGVRKTVGQSKAKTSLPARLCELALGNLRQLLVNRRYRVVYQYDEASAAIRVLAIQTCRQQLPTESELKRSLQKGFY